MNSLIALGCDGTNVNICIKGGQIVLMDHYLERQLHWFICMLHANELPLRNLITNLNGKISGPRCFTGLIGKDLQNSEKRPVEDFTPVDAPAIVTAATYLSTDVKYLLDIHEAKSSG